ncbi:MAG TPA: type II CAAX endopeptidase family protein [Usitatibacter sp.]|jgi:membrane protease YdiL (CAAX protease family)|nr:type II CAAX endopeptidase family protein [Usitatibacter sp.]
MTARDGLRKGWAALPVALRAVVAGILIALVAANVWPALLLALGVPLASILEMLFLAAYVWWARGGGMPRGTSTARSIAFRSRKLSSRQWLWGLLAALSFGVTIHAAIVLLFRFTPYPIDAFRRGYDFSFIPSPSLRWIAVVVSAASAGICEETGFRGYMQQPIEERHGVPVAILVSACVFMLVHLGKGWATAGMVPIVFGAGILLGLLAWSSRSLVPGMVGHVAMDIGLFAYWWTGIAGTFALRPISETGVDPPFLIACAVFAASLCVVLGSMAQLRRVRG